MELETVIGEFCLQGFAEVLTLFSKLLLPNSTASGSLFSKSSLHFTNKLDKSPKCVKNFNLHILEIKRVTREQRTICKCETCPNTKLLSPCELNIFWVFIMPVLIPPSLPLKNLTTINVNVKIFYFVPFDFIIILFDLLFFWRQLTTSDFRIIIIHLLHSDMES